MNDKNMSDKYKLKIRKMRKTIHIDAPKISVATRLKLSLILPSYGRPQLTERAIRSVLAQTFDGAEVFFFGDNCAVFANIIANNWFLSAHNTIVDRIKIHTRNYDKRDGTPTRIINDAIALAKGEYLLFMANDDQIQPGHFENYYGFAKTNDVDMAYFNSIVDVNGTTYLRNAVIKFRHIGHSEIAVRTSIAKTVPPHHRSYGHDWDFIRSVLTASDPKKVIKSQNEPTYIVNRGKREHVYESELNE